jgi:hypothetical protein
MSATPLDFSPVPEWDGEPDAVDELVDWQLSQPEQGYSRAEWQAVLDRFR